MGISYSRYMKKKTFLKNVDILLFGARVFAN